MGVVIKSSRSMHSQAGAWERENVTKTYLPNKEKYKCYLETYNAR